MKYVYGWGLRCLFENKRQPHLISIRPSAYGVTVCEMGCNLVSL